jgi:hypothetical protein
MAAPTVRAFSTPNNSTDAAPAFTVNAPAGVATGDLLLAFAANDTTGTAWTVSPGNGWVKLSDEVEGSTHRLAVYALIADGSDTLSIAAANNQDYSVVMVAIEVGTHGVSDVSTDIVIPAAATSTTGNADPPASGTVASKDWRAIAVCAADFTNAGDAISAAPTNYTTGAVLTKSASSTSSVGLGVGHRALTAATSEDPGTFTNTSRPWIAKTLLVPPPAAGQAVSPTGPTVTVTAGTPAITRTVTPTGPTVTVTPGTGTVTNSIVSGEYEMSLTDPATSPTVNTDHSVTVRAWATAGAGDLLVRLMQGATEIDSWSETLTGSAVDYTHPVDSGDAANITDYSDLRVELKSRGFTGLTVRVSQVYVTFPVGVAVQDITPTGPTVTVTAGTPALSRTVTPTGPTVTVTVGSPALTRTVTPTGPAVTVTAGTVALSYNQPVTPTGATVTVTAGTTVVATTPRITVSGRKLLKGSDVFHMKAMSLWGLTTNIGNSDITTCLEAIHDLGFNCATFAPCGMDLNGAEGWSQFTNQATSEAYFTGSPITSTLGPAWDTHVIHALNELLRLDMYALFSLYTGFNNTDGLGTELIAAGAGAAFTYGQRVGAKVGAYDNLILHYGADISFDHPSDPATMVDAWFEGFFDGAGRDDFVIVAEPAEGRTSYSQFISQAGVGDYEFFVPNVNSVYETAANSTERFETVWSESGATSYPVWDCEPAYVDSVRDSSADVQELREQIYAEAFEGGCGINYGHERICGLGGDTGFVDDPDWEAALGDVELEHAMHAFTILDEWTLDTTYGPDATWVTTGEGSGDTKAALGKSDSVLLGYFPTSRTLEVDTTVFTGSSAVRLRWYDPTAGTYSTIAASEAQQTGRSVSFPSNHGDGFSDWVLVVDAAIAISPTGPTVTVTAGTPAISRAVTPTGPTVAVIAGTPVLARTVTPTGATVAVTPGTATVVSGVSVVPDGPTVTVTAGTLDVDLTVTPTGATVAVTPGTATVAADQTVTPTGPTVTVTPGSATVQVGVSAISPVSATITVTAGTPTLARTMTPTGATVAVSAGTVTIARTITPTGATISVTAGAVTVAGDGEIGPTGVTVTVTAGTLLVSVAALTVPLSHIYVVPAESRTYTVPAESRTYIVKAGT